jgi:hypothetical protein
MDSVLDKKRGNWNIVGHFKQKNYQPFGSQTVSAALKTKHLRTGSNHSGFP